MTAFLQRHSTTILLSLLVTLLVLAWVFPAAGWSLGVAFLLVSFLIAGSVVLEKHRKAYRKGEIARGVFIRNAVLEITGTGLVMTLAGVLGRYAAEVATRQIGGDLLRVLAGVAVGLLVGLGVGVLGKQTLRRLVEVPPRRGEPTG